MIFLNDSKKRVESFFDRHFSSTANAQTGIQRVREAMLYSLQAGGKRYRPALVYGAVQALGKPLDWGDRPAAAVEMVHTYSLIHDDLPCMDNDDLRRGLPTCHKKFDEATAVLAGDGLLTEAFAVLAGHPKCGDWVNELARGSGFLGMVGGQMLDLFFEGKSVTANELELIHQSKTGALIRASVRMGAFAADANPENLEQLTKFAEYLGLAFQVADDVLDATQDSQTLGKTAGKDLAAKKATYPALMGLEAATKYATELGDKAVASLDCFGTSAIALRDIAKFTVQRNH